MKISKYTPRLALVAVAIITGSVGVYALIRSSAAVPGCDQTVSSVSAAQTAVSSAAGGTTVCMAAGSYGSITLSGSHSANVTFQADPSGDVNGAGKVTFSGINVTGTHITVRNFYTTRGLNFTKPAANDVADHNDVTNSAGGYGITVSCNSGTQPGCSGFTFSGNRIHDLTGTDGSSGSSCSTYGDDGDGIRLDGWADVTVTGNELYHIDQIDASACAGHTDCLQSYNANVNTSGPFVLTKNYAHDNQCQGPPFLKDGNVQNVTITNNLSVRSTRKGLSDTALFIVGNTTGATIKNNVYLGGGSFLQSSGSSPTASANVDHNIFGQLNISGYSLPGEGYNIFTDGNQWSFNPSSTDLPQGAYGTKYTPVYKCGSSCGNGTAAGDDYRLATNPNNIGIDWAPAEQTYGPVNGSGGSTTPPPSDTTAPTVSLTAPSANATVSGTSTTVSASATDNVGVTGVQFKLDGNNLGSEDTSSPYSTTWNTTTATNGTHTLTAIAKDAAGNTKTSSSVTVTVSNTTGGGSTASDLLFNGTKISDYLVQAAPGAITQVADPAGSSQQVFKYVVKNTDVAPVTPTENPRAQLVGPDDINLGDDVWLENKFFLPNDFPSNVPGWMALFATYGPPFDGSGPWGVGVSGSQIQWQRNDTYNYDIPWSIPIVKNQWVTVLVHEKFDVNGFIEMWINGQPVTFFAKNSTNYYNPNNIASTTHLAMKTADHTNNGGANSGRVMEYRQLGMFDSVTTYHGPLIVGKTQASVEAAAAANGEASTPASPSDTAAPTVSFSSPANGSTVSGTVTATVGASDNVAVTKVELSLDGSLKMTDTASPYNYSFDSKTLTNGSHTLTAKAYDAAGNTKTATVTFTVNNADTTPPGTPTNLKATASNATTVNLAWTGSTDSGTNSSGIDHYNVLRNGVVIAQVPGTTYTDTGGVANTSYSYVVQAADKAGNVSASSSPSNVTTPGGGSGNPGSALIFSDNFDDGESFIGGKDTVNGKWYVQSPPNRITNVAGGAGQGTRYVHFQVDQGDVEPDTGSSRAELTGPTFDEGDDIYIRDRIRVPNNITFAGDWELINQLHETNWGSSPGIAIFLNPGPKFNLRNGAGSPNFWESTKLNTNQWYEVIYHVKLSQDPAVGMTQVWLDGVPQTLKNGQTTMYGKTIQTSQTYLKIGIYRSSTSTGTSLIDHDDIAVGTTYNSVSGGSTTAPADTTAPSTPTNLKATAASTGQVNLSWNASTDSGGSGLAGYNIYRNGSKLNTSPVTTTSYGDSTVNAGSSYTYNVEAVDGAGNKSAQTAGVTAVTSAAKRGDITGSAGVPDGVIDIRDVSYVIRTYNTNDPNGDVSGPNGTPDGKVDLYDLSYIIRNYGK